MPKLLTGCRTSGKSSSFSGLCFPLWEKEEVGLEERFSHCAPRNPQGFPRALLRVVEGEKKGVECVRLQASPPCFNKSISALTQIFRI